MSEALYAPRFVVESLRLAPAPDAVAPTAGACMCCGHPITPGDEVATPQFGRKWLDFPTLAVRESRVLCRWCPATLHHAFMRRYQKLVVSQAGAFPMARLEDRVALLVRPPAGASFWMHGLAKMQHLVIKGQLTLDPDLIQLQLGDRTTLIRRPWLLDVARRTIAHRENTPGHTMPIHLLLDGMDERHGAATSTASDELIRDYACLSAGELWALTALVYRPDWEAYPMPDPIPTTAFM